MKRRVVVTGVGLVTPLGVGIENVWKRILNGESGIGPTTRFDVTKHDTKFAGEVKDFMAGDFVSPKEIKRIDLFIQYALAASKIAIEDSGLDMGREEAERVGVVVGTGLGGLPTLEKYHSILLERGPGRISPFFIPMLIANEAPGHIAIQFGMKGPNLCIVTACATGAHSIGESFRIIQYGDADVMVAGGTEANLTPLTVGGFNAMKALSTRNDAPEKASRPFEKDRDGFVVSEGCGIIIMEELEHAKKRGAKIYAEIAGYGYNGDAYHITAPCPDGDGFVRCIKVALKDANIRPEEVDYINAHGTSTELNDYIETLAIKEVFKDGAYKIPVSSTKSMTGHLLGAAGAIEAIFSVLSIRDQICPPTINYETPDPQCDLDYVPNVSRKHKIDVVLSNSFGFGGTNSTLVFRRYLL
ncbi:MAG TPA: beta-ketoacyl-ACP synthase II [Syntrophorhabdaceae bacterium]|nr:3-oxoacyl-[acyl-carrier-protein] synthase 2 [Syntrophorhabdaceae bacterium]MDI9562240.1 beta-ketoacyl-ACP synthase II [Pseudomonadota bacterium]HNQ63549.1 beta-ketoacyl-ACP synthase II [Syntrophorhabdaceae bacterium]HNZ58381.1 beta-ketoacyl-ACP synthase II [Syntrophorhabdaceae bacterium]HOG39338.1 beta-ketoacyl-ACP synthase II [Syntrophorhabdaceae bacterium]